MATTLIRPDGRKVSVEDDKLSAAVDAGYRFRTVKEIDHASDAESPVTAAAAGLLRGASAGLSDAAFVGAGELLDQMSGTRPVRSVSEQLGGMREANPLASTAGEVGGTIAGMAVGGPVRGIAAVGNATRAAAGAGLRGAVAAGAVEGTLYGLGTMVSEASLGDPTTNAQKLAGVGGGALFGAALNAATHGIGSGVSALTKALGGKTLQGALEGLADAGLQAQLGSKKVMNKRQLYGKNADDVFDYARENGLVNGGDDAKSFLERVNKHRIGIGDETGAILKDAGTRRPNFDADALYARVKSELLPVLEKDPSNRGSINRIVNYMDDLEALGPQGHTLESAWGLQSSLKKQVGFGEADGLLKQNLDKFRNLMRSEIKDQATATSPHFGAMLDDTSSRYRFAKILEDLGEEAVKKQQSSGFLGLKDTIIGAGLAGGAIGGFGGAIGAIGAKVARERGGFMLNAAATKLSQSKTLERIADSLKLAIQGIGDMGMLGAYRPLLEQAAARGSMNLLATHVQLAQTDPKYLPTLGMMTEEGEAANQYAEKAEALEAVAKKLQEHDDEVENSVAHLLKSKGGVAPKPQRAVPSMADFEARLKRITTVLANPETVDTSALAAVAPALAMESSVQAQNAAGFLLSKAPKNPYPGLPAFSRPWVISKAELGKFYRYVDAAERPGDVMKDLARNGFVTKEARETMQMLYPQLLEDMKNRLMDRLMDLKEPLPYSQRRGLGALFGDGFINHNPQELGLLQQLHAGSVAGQQQQGAGPKKDGRQNQSQEDNVATQAQRTEAR